MLSVALAEIRGILAAAGLRDGLDVLSVDAAVNARQRVVHAGTVRLEGGGGTDMGVGLAAAERLSPRPEIAIVVTDGYTPWPEHPPRGIRTIVVKTDARGTSPPWARTVVVPPDAVPKQIARNA
jgi:predicted metal-dependent peptidase